MDTLTVCIRRLMGTLLERDLQSAKPFIISIKFYYCSEVPTEASSPTLSFIVPAHRTLDVGSVQWIRCIVAHLPDVIYTIPQYLDFQIYSNNIERTLIVTEKYSCISCTITRFISSYLEFNSG